MAPHRTQAGRREATRHALVNAAVDSLLERGWGGTTAVEVCARAGVTRGALVHHFGDLGGLLAEALRQLLASIARDGEPATDLVGLLDQTWAAIGSPRFKAVLEAWFAAANDPSLRPDLGPIVGGFAKLVDPGQFDAPALRRADGRTFYLLAREAMLGLAVGRATNGGYPIAHEAAVLDRLRSEARTFDRTNDPNRTRRAR